MIFCVSYSQNCDSLNKSLEKPSAKADLPAKQKIVRRFMTPSILIGIGSIRPGHEGPFNINYYVQHTTHVHWKPGISKIDDYIQYTPAVAVYTLDVLLVKPQHSFLKRSKLLVAGNILMALSIYSIKGLTQVERPDKAGFRSFPSGHAATAFLSADFFYQEFRYKKKWWIYTGYVAAAATGAYRVLNNKHWITDVIAGAGLGILFNRISYLLLDKKNKKISTS